MLHQSVPASIRVALVFDGIESVDYRGEYGSIPEVRVRPSMLSSARVAKLENALRRHFGSAVEFADDAADRVFVGRAEKIGFAGLAETQGKGGNAFVNLDAEASDRELFAVASHEIGHLVGTVSHDGEGLAAVAYTGGAANVTLSTGVLNGSSIANEAYVADEPYAQSVGLTADAAASNCTVVSGGILYIDNGANAVQNGGIAIGSNGVVRVRSKGLVDGVTMNGGTLSAWAGTVNDLNAVNAQEILINGTLLSNGTVTGGRLYTQYAAKLNNVTFRDGAVGSMVSGSIDSDICVSNATLIVSSNAKVNTLETYENAKITVLATGSALLSGNVSIGDLQMNGGFVSSAAAVTGAITGGQIQGGAKLWIRPGMTVSNLSATGANTLLTTFQGGLTNIYASDGVTVNVNNAVMDNSLIDTGATLIVSNRGTVSNTDIRSTTVTIVNGSAVNVRVSGGTMDIQAGGQVSSAVISGATVDVQSLGRISGLTAQKDTVVNLSSGGIIYGINGEAGAQVNIYTGGSGNILAGDSAAGVFIKAGGSAFVGGGIIYGVSATDAAKGMLRVSAGASALGGKLTGATFTMVASGNNAYMSGFEFGSGIYAYVRTGALVDDTTILAGGQINLQGGDTNKIVVSSGGTMNVSTGTATSTTLYTGAKHTASGGAMLVDYNISGYELLISSGVTLNGATVGASDTARGTLRFYAGATGSNLVLSGNAFVTMDGAGDAVNGIQLLAGGSAEVRANATASNLVMSGTGIRLRVAGGAAVTGATINGYEGGKGSATVTSAAMDSVTVLGSGMLDLKLGATASGVIVSGGTGWASGTLVEDLTLTGSDGAKGYFRLYNGVTLNGGLVSGNAILTADNEGTLASGVTVVGNGEVNIRASADARELNVIDGRAYADNSNTRLDTATVGGGSFAYLGIRMGAAATSLTVLSGGAVNVSDATLDGVTVSSGGAFGITGAARVTGLVASEGATVTLNFSGASGETALLDTLAGVNTGNAIIVDGDNLGDFLVADTGNTAAKFVVNYQLFDTEIGVGEYVNPFWKGRKYTVGAGGTTFKVEEYTMSDTILTTEAADLATSGAVINGGDKALLWSDVELAAGSAVTYVTNAAGINGDAWLDLQRTQMDAKATVYGAAGNYAGTIRSLSPGAGTIGNFAAGAAAGGTVGNVELVGYNNTYNLTYLGGMGNVTGHVSAAISSGNTLAKDFYAGALANYAKTHEATSIGSINATIAMKNDGTNKVKGNIYGASAVKAGTITAATTVHTVGDVTLTITGGTASKNDICVFAGGYATGHDSAKAAAVYTVASVTATIAGGEWGGAHGGRGVFGGAFASDNVADGSEAAGVWAKVGDVNLTISGGSMGNVYGGGWAQKGAKSEVGNVNITISGGTIANVFGGGSTSDGQGSTKGSTVAGDVTITVSGGTISGAIFAKGQSATDSVGSAAVVFTGANDFDCNVYGFSYVGGAASDATLSFSAYTGTFSGKIGGFDGVTFAGDTAMTLETAAEDVANTAWIFDAAERGITGAAFLDWDAADFTDDTITLNLATGDANEWTLVSAAANTNYNTFALQVNEADIATGLTLGEAISGTGTAYDGWGFKLDGDTLKFAKITA